MYRLETYWIEGDDPICFRHTEKHTGETVDGLLQTAFMARLNAGESWVGYRIVHQKASGPEPVVFEKFMSGSVKDQWTRAFSGDPSDD